MPPDEEEAGQLQGETSKSVKKSTPPAHLENIKQKVRQSFQRTGGKKQTKPDAGKKSRSSPIVTFRQLICAKVHGEIQEEFISVLQALGFKNIAAWEFIGKRRAALMFAKTLPNSLRIHLRLYEVGSMQYVLAHREPQPFTDVKFHVNGFLRWIQGTRSKKPAKEDTGEESPQADFRTELADYEAGGDIFKRIIKTVPNFLKKVDFDITEEDLRLFNAKYGSIDHIPVVTLLLENFLESAESNFGGVARSLPKMLEIFGFQVVADPIETGEMPRFIAKAIYAERYYTIFISIASKSDENIVQFSHRAQQQDAKYSLLIVPDDGMASEMESLATDVQINVITASNFGIFFLENGDYPFSQEEIENLFLLDGGVIPISRVYKLIQDKKKSEQIFTQCQKILDILQNAGIWLSIKEIEHRAEELEDLPRDQIQSILSFLTNPIIGLAETQKGKSFKAILNREAIHLKLKKLEDFIKNIRPTQTIL